MSHSSVPFIFTKSAITVSINGRVHSIPTTAPNYQALKQALISNAPEKEIAKILNIKAYIAQITEGRAEIVDGALYFDGAPLHGALAERVAVMFAEGFGVLPFLRFLNRLAENKRNDIANELYQFLEASTLPITEDGFILAYKMVRDDFTDIYTGTMNNSPGVLVSLTSYDEVDPIRTNTCSRGLHFASLNYILNGNYGHKESGHRLVQVLIDPADIASIPTDYDFSKGRAWRYQILREISWDDRIKPSFVTNSYVTTGDVSGSDNVDESDDDCVESEPEAVAESPASYVTGAKLDENKVRAIRNYENKSTPTAVGNLYGISPRQVKRIWSREAWSWVS